MAAALASVDRGLAWAHEAVRFRLRKYLVRPWWERVGLPYWRGRLETAVERTRPVPVPDGAEAAAAVHMLVGASQLGEAIASLKSLYRFLPAPLPLVVHEDGTLGEPERARLARHFPGVQVIDRRAADDAMPALLERHGLARCAALRRSRFVFALRLFDVPHHASGRRIVQMDSDVLFFSRPEALLAQLATGPGDWRDRYNEDTPDGYYYAFTREQMRATLGFDVRPRLNAGLTCLERDVESWRTFERALAMEPTPGLDWFLEQTLTAIESSRRGAEPLPPEYDVCLRARGHGARVVSEHYSGPSRPAFYADFVRRIAPELT